MHRRTLLTAALALAAAGCAGPSTTSGSPAASGSAPTSRAVIGLSYIPNVQFAPFYVGVNDKLFDPVPAQVSLRHHGATEGLFNALTSGAEDFLVAAGSEAMQARAEGVDVIAVGAYYKSFPVQVLALDSSPVQALADLKGRRLGVPGRYGESWLAAQVALNTAGLTEADVTIVEVGYTQVAALTTKKVDAVVGFTTNELVQLQLAGANPRALPVAAGTVPWSAPACSPPPRTPRRTPRSSARWCRRWRARSRPPLPTSRRRSTSPPPRFRGGRPRPGPTPKRCCRRPST